MRMSKKPIVLIINDVKPQPKQRPTYNFKTRSAITPKKTRDYERTIGLYARRFIKKEDVIDGAIKATMKFVFEVPKSWSKSKKEDALNGKIFPTGKNLADIDNLQKSVLDGIFEKEHGIAHLGMDDRQIVEVSAVKKYGTSNQIIIVLEEYKND